MFTSNIFIQYYISHDCLYFQSGAGKTGMLTNLVSGIVSSLSKVRIDFTVNEQLSIANISFVFEQATIANESIVFEQVSIANKSVVFKHVTIPNEGTIFFKQDE